MFRGLGTTICREVPGFGIYFFAYEFMTRSAAENSDTVSTFHMLLAGGVSGTLSWVLTYPIDVVKSRLQVDGMDGVCKYSGFVDCLKKSIQAEGYCVMTRGLTSTILRAFPTNAATFTVVTWVIRWADATHAENTSRYMIPELVDLTAFENSKTPNRFNDDAKLWVKAFGLLENLEYKEKYAKSFFEWRKIMHHNFMGNNFFCTQQLMPQSSQVYSPDKGDSSQTCFSDKIREDLCLQLKLLEESKKDAMIKEKEQELKEDEGSEEQDATNCEKEHADSDIDKEPNTDEHKSDLYNSSVR